MTKDFSYLINVYKQTLNDKKDFIKTRSIHWDNFYEKNNKFFDIKNLINFRKNQILSKGLDDAMNLQNKLDLIEALDHFNNSFLRKNLPKTNVGNCQYSINYLGYYFDYGIIHHLKWYEKIENFIQNDDYVLEIGGGFGSLARIILLNKNVKYFLIDLPETNMMSNYYLQNHFPEKKIFNYLDFKKYNIENEIKNFDIFILPPNSLNKKNINYNFIINARSFMEMNIDTITNYFQFIQDKIKNNGYFLNINRYLKYSAGEDIKFENYPYDNFWETEISEKSFLQNHIHFMLTKRIAKDGNIQAELTNLKKNNAEWKNKNLEKFRSFKHSYKKIFYKIISNSLKFVFSKKSLKKISKIIYNISEK